MTFLGLADIVDLGKYREQRAASDLAFDAVTADEQEAAHLSMRKAFPLLSREFPCTCEACKAEGRP